MIFSVLRFFSFHKIFFDNSYIIIRKEKLPVGTWDVIIADFSKIVCEIFVVFERNDGSSEAMSP